MIASARVLLAATALLAMALPALAQNQAVPLLRVYTYAPYFYDFLADIGAPLAGGDFPLHLYLEGKEVGASNIVFNCDDGTWEEEVLTDWTGGSDDFVDAALTSFDKMYCGL